MKNRSTSIRAVVSRPAPVLPVILLFIFIALAAPPSNAGDTPYGINCHIPDRALLESLRDADIHWIRCDFNWYIAEPQQDQWSWGIFDRLVADADELGFRIFPTLGYAPSWANGGREPQYPPEDPADWEDFVTETVTRYRSSIKYWGMWNEPNLDGFFAGTLDQYIEEILKVGSTAVHTADPTAFVLGPELAHLSGWDDWMKRVCRDAIGYFDIITHHCYKDWPWDVFRHLEGPLWPWDPTLLGVLEDYGAEGMEVWLTETGWRSDEIGEWSQGQYYHNLLVGVDERDWLTKVFFYEAKDDPNIEAKWGILRDDLTKKEAYDRYRDYSRNHEGLHYLLKCRELPAWREVVLDGSLDEWGGYAPGVGLNLNDYYREGELPWGAGDINAMFYAVWDGDGIRLAARVTDDAHHNPYGGENIWMGDGIQIALDTDYDRTVGAYDTDGDYEYGIALTTGGVVVHRWTAPDGSPPTLAAGGASRNGNTTSYEVFIPMAEFISKGGPGERGDLTLGDTLGFDIIVNENDGGGREGWLEWTQGIGQLKDPSSFGKLALEPAAADVTHWLSCEDSAVEIPQGGGSFTFSLTVANPAPEAQRVTLWTSAIIPKNREFSPLLGPVSVTIPPNDSVTYNDITQNVPAQLDEGVTRYSVEIGNSYPVADRQASFIILKRGY